MLDLVIGGSASGKSEFAEQLALRRSRCADRGFAVGPGDLSMVREDDQPDKDPENLIYLATMCAGDEESRERVAAHQKRRAGRGFSTEELPVDVGGLAVSGGTVLLECLSNLAANELFGYSGNFPEKMRDPQQVFEKIIRDITALSEKAGNLVIVTNDIFEDCAGYGHEMQSYLWLLGELNRAIAAVADSVTEVMCGIPSEVKTAADEDPADKRKTLADEDPEDKGKALSDGAPEDKRKTLSEESLADKTKALSDEHPADKRKASTDIKASGCSKDIILIVGGACQGKAEFAKKLYYELFGAVSSRGPVIADGASGIPEKLSDIDILIDLQEIVRCELLAGADAARIVETILQCKPGLIVTADLIGSGPVPVDAFDRRLRDEAGEVCRLLAERAGHVYRVICGIPHKIK